MHRLLIDTDPGEDDALAIMMAAAHSQANIEALMTVSGNVSLAHTTNNAAVVLDRIGLDRPIYPGCAQALVHVGIDASYAHGNDGLGNTGFTSDRSIETTHAAIELVKRVNAEPNELTLVTLGPMTNIATALKLDPKLPYKVKRMIAMAGAVTARGNVGVSAEFNIYADPEAAHVVFEAWGAADKLIDVADWELTMRNGISKSVRDQWASLDTQQSRFFTAISAHSNRFIEEVRKRTINYFADPVAMAIALEPNIITQSETHHLTVSLTGQFSRGQTIVDWQDTSDKPHNARIILNIDATRFHELALQALSA